MSQIAYEMGVKAGLEIAAKYCETNEMGISSNAGGKYTPHHSTVFEQGFGTHAGMGYAEALRTLKKDVHKWESD